MYSKKFFSCDTLKGSAFTSSDCEDTETTVTHCIGSDKKIYEVTNTETFACNTTPLAKNVYIFNVPEDTYTSLGASKPSDWDTDCTTKYYSDDAGTLATGECTSNWADNSFYQKNVGIKNVKVVSLTTEDDTDPLDSIAGRLVMYVCDAQKECKQTIGYIKMDYDTDNTLRSSYYKILATGGAIADAGSACDGSTNIGDVSGTRGVCLSVSGKSVEFSAPGDYLLDGTLAGGSIFTLPSSNGNNALVLTATSNVIYYNKAFTQTDYCVDNATKKIEVKTSQVCGTNNCEKYFSCTSGDCQDTTNESCTPQPTNNDCNLATSDAQNCDKGYYLADAGTTTLVDDGEEGDLYECKENEVTPAQIDCTNISETNKNIPLGYLINADYQHNSDYPIIECYLNQGTRKCKAVDVTDISCGTSGTNVATAGKIFSNDGKTTFKICLDGTNSGIKGGAALSYLMNASGTLGITAKADNFIVVNIDTAGNIKIELKDDVTTVNKYKFTNNNKKIITRDSTDKDTYCTVDPITLVDYKLNKCEDGVADGDLVYYYKSA
ncbi:hypothetical protein LY90DRAFT_512894 [Neocallimastix californiae]|uniref:Uncharacterized protein n=1 Tax=Neocallimastix californiae TaxID=1754190 RepID=A0A1Y2B3U1_9FUNG|nr:hypothetical protein LY90DRAFT_512894 [Neocallimastix californiae]|eukprot:ORY29404.1 hypothetical protein LY90DRAFT_512894 [Neocallimastix californiae]